MSPDKILVTGATGKTGAVVTSELLRVGYPVRAMVRREDARSARLKTQGAEIAVADMSDGEHGAEDMAKAIGHAVGRSVRAAPTPPSPRRRAATRSVPPPPADAGLTLSPSGGRTPAASPPERCASNRRSFLENSHDRYDQHGAPAL